jgi:hypothetical protein
MKLVLGLNIPLENPLDTINRRPGFKVSDFFCFQKGISTHECEYFMQVPGMCA